MHRMVLGKSDSGGGHRTIESGWSAANKLSSFEKIFINPELFTETSKL